MMFIELMKDENVQKFCNNNNIQALKYINRSGPRSTLEASYFIKCLNTVNSRVLILPIVKFLPKDE